MDKTDKRIIEMLARGSDVTSTEISEELHFSIPTVNKRIRDLKKDGIIKNYTVITDNKLIGKPIVAFILIVLKSVEHTESFFEYVEGDKDMLECYAVTGEYDCIIKVCATSLEELDRKLAVLKTQSGVMKSYTMLSLTTHKYQPTVLPD